ncbi:hypothetical protein AAZX31_08G234900 [Glycine max]|uniref:TMEM205-like domain-containing protein n=1 Tax=Glycine max TaxID=3847 RepID=I1KW97_SOYBN|nr:uncharacterized protein LOC100808861 [Glycine max]KAG5001111.1 hypothetical protein JHK87_022183 [Glycine soja]KAG5016610.1 hypothetical protein JHK85_022746 [Glycine max]KAG5026369.1 hypothetical protein JHK86_022283 [Glycine max]KAG5137525.1 hypothetical protein JHK82_022256 [Glycine max]KAH1052811.1 hypothetical protein GYH30_022216 [Glycine max]|eukprot:XP_006585749.1 uncharacterized protein LOC100808861 [Glycine max]
MMMNVLGLSLVLTSLAAAGIFSPNPRTEKHGASTIVKEGHRVVVVEYDQGGHQKTKISISPEQPTHHHDHDDDLIKEAASVLPNLCQGISSSSQYSHQPQNHMDHGPLNLHAPNPKELICDAYGKCKHKISDAMEKAQEAIHKKKDKICKTKETVYDKAHDVHEYAQDTVEAAKEDMASNVSNAKDALKLLIGGSMESLNSLMGVANLLGFATAYGICVWVTFISSYVQSRTMPRQQFAVVQSKIYPVYFRAMAYSIALAFLAHFLAHRNTNSDMLQSYNLLASLATLFLNYLYLEPRATKLMLERIKIEKEEGRGRSQDMMSSRTVDPKEPADQEDALRSRIIKLNDKLKKFNSYSSFLNILNLMSLTWHLVYLAQRLHHIC